ncbi:MAG: DUF983 domain-containing protein [Pyrinomonadaceae bacterium]
MLPRKGKSKPSISQALTRCIRLLCPACGQASIVKKPFHIKDYCNSCLARFEREEGFFVGAILVNVVTTELVILFTYLVSLGVVAAHYQAVLTVLLVLALLFPVAFYHHSWSIWLTFDHAVEGLPKL